MIRFCDIAMSIFGLIFTSPFLVIVFVIAFFDTGAPIFTQERLGQFQKTFRVMKFRTMRLDTDSVVTHRVDPQQITWFGKILRHSKIDELPQLFNVLKGEMSLVGPRPGLPDHYELTRSREALGVYDARPGITGLAQISGIDMSTPGLLAEIDAKMLEDLTVKLYFRYIILTILGKGQGDRVVGHVDSNDRGDD